MPIFAVIMGGSVTLLWAWAFCHAREDYLQAQITAAKANEARATRAADQATAKRGARSKG